MLTGGANDYNDRVAAASAKSRGEIRQVAAWMALRVDAVGMFLQKLPMAEVLLAIDVYLTLAYCGPAPAPVRAKLDTLRSLPPEDFYTSPIFERDAAASPSKLSLRLGNRMYPHMKLTIERSPDTNASLFRAATHHPHVCPP